MNTLYKISFFKVLIASLLILPSTLIAAPKYSVGDRFSLIHYQDKEGVYVQIEMINEHPFLDYFYEISFHGICIRNLITPHAFAFENMYLSESAFSKSITDKVNDLQSKSIRCTAIPERPDLADIKPNQSNVLNGMQGVLISPLTPILSSDKIINPERIITEW